MQRSLEASLSRESAVSRFLFNALNSETDHRGHVRFRCGESRRVRRYMQEMLCYMDSRRATFHLILERAEGTPFAGLIDKMVAIEIAATERYCEVLRGLGKTVPDIDRRLEHMLVTGMMNAYCEIIIHDIPFADAKRYVEELGDFYTAGWLKLMGQ